MIPKFVIIPVSSRQIEYRYISYALTLPKVLMHPFVDPMEVSPDLEAMNDMDGFSPVVRRISLC